MGSGISSRLKKSNVSKSQPEGKVQYAERCSSDEVSALNIVERLWKQIDSQQFKEAFEDKKITKTGWKEIRVFVSSTFSDMHSEREILVKKVFPELRDWCEERRCTLTECDLRWGIPKDTESNTTISVCLEEIDRCYEVNNGTPYFVNMLSERYGWIPSENEVSEEIREKYSWVPNISITHMEILHGAYRTGNPNAFFCLRNPKFVSDLPQQHLNKFMETEALPKLHLEVLKSKLQEKFGDQCITYDCKVSGIDQHTGRDKVKLTGLEDFGQKVLNFLKSAISRQYLDVGIIEELSEGDQEEIIHLRTASLQGSFVVGRSKEFEAVNSYLKESFVSELFVSNADEQEVLRSEAEECGSNNNKILCISGIPGLGKCSILCDCAGKLMESGSKVLFHCTGCTTGSCDWRSIVKRIIRLDGSEEADEDDEQILLEKMKKVLKKINKCIILFICRLENMYNNESVDCLEWLPARFPANIKCVVSVDSNNYICMNRLEKKECHFLQLENFTLDEASLFVQEYLLKYNKKLDEEQMRSFLSKKSSTFPLWLKVASEELRVFGDFVTLSNKIKSFPDNLKDLIKEVIDRLVREDETSLMGKLLSLMLCSHSGLPESEICKLLGEPMKGVESAPIAWATIRRQLKPFIIEMKFHRTSKVTFMHKAFTEAAKDLMLNEKNSQKWNLYLADYFELYNKDEIYLEDDLAHNLFHAGCWKRLSTFYRTDVRTFSMNALFKSRLLHRIRCKQLIFPQASCKVLICNLCSTKSRLMSVLPNMTKDLCYLCGCWVPFKHENDIAKLCLKHRTHFSDNFKKCFHCNQHIMTPNPPHMYLCNFCKFGNHCSYLMEGCND